MSSSLSHTLEHDGMSIAEEISASCSNIVTSAQDIADVTIGVKPNDFFVRGGKAQGIVDDSEPAHHVKRNSRNDNANCSKTRDQSPTHTWTPVHSALGSLWSMVHQLRGFVQFNTVRDSSHRWTWLLRTCRAIVWPAKRGNHELDFQLSRTVTDIVTKLAIVSLLTYIFTASSSYDYACT